MIDGRQKYVLLCCPIRHSAHDPNPRLWRSSNTEEDVRDTLLETVDAVNNQDFNKLAQLITVNTFGTEPTAEALERDLPSRGFKIENLEIVSVSVAGNEATIEIARADGDVPIRETANLIKSDGRWRVWIESMDSSKC